MEKKSKLAKHAKQKLIIEKFRAKRAELKAIINGKAKSVEEYNDARQKLAELPRDSNPTRMHNRCQLTGRPRGYYRDFGLCRNQLRQLAHEGKLPGVVKSSW
jgi:small subunit ribosomal protein S14